MPLTYNLTNVTDANTIPDLVFGSVNSLVGGWFGTMVIISVFIILFVTFQSFGGKRAFAAASFITALLSLMLSVMSAINPFVLTLCILGAGLGVVLLIIE